MSAKTKTTNNVDLKRKVSIRQYVDPEVFNLGMEKYNMSVWSGETGSGGVKESLGYKTVGNKKIYLTGLDVNATSLNNLEEDTKKQKVMEIESVLKYLSVIYGEETLKSDNDSFWADLFLEIKSPILELDLEDVNDLLKYYAIQGGGYTEVAPSYDVAKNSNKIYKFYLHEENEVAELKTEIKRLRNRAKSILEDLFVEDPEKLFKMSKILLPIEKGLTRNVSKNTIYSELDIYIDGEYTKNEIKQAPKRFIELSEKDRGSLNIQAIVKEALYQRYIVKNSESTYWNPQTQSPFGRNENEIIAYLNNPLNGDELTIIKDRVEGFWK